MCSARAMVAALGGRWHGPYGVARCPAHDDRSPSLSIRDGETGVLLRCHAGCETRGVIAALRTRGLWEAPGDRSAPRDPRPDRSPGDDHREATGHALAVLGRTQPAAGTLVEMYLRDARAVIVGPPPEVIRYAPDLRHPTGPRLPAMVAAVQQADGRITGCHRTWIHPDGSGKAAVSPQKAMLGRVARGAVRLTPAGETLQVCEGIETGLAILSATRAPTWAALSTSGLRALTLPAEVRRVIICADGDDAGEAAADAAAQRWLAEGRGVYIAPAPRGTDFADFAISAMATAKAAKVAKAAAPAGRAV